MLVYKTKKNRNSSLNARSKLVINSRLKSKDFGFLGIILLLSFAILKLIACIGGNM